MPRFIYTTAKEVFAKVIRNTGYKLPADYHDDMLEWLPEGLNMLNSTNLYQTLSTPIITDPTALTIVNHVADLPCGMIAILAVEDEFGRRIPEGGNTKDIANPSTQSFGPFAARPTVFEVDPNEHQTTDGTPTTAPGTSIPIYGEDVTTTSSTSGASYYKQMGTKIQTSFETGIIRIHYTGLVVDEEGYPMIPDNENFKTALYWYILMMLIGAGYEHKVFSYKDTEAQFEKFAGRALGELKFPSLDEKARVHRANTRLVPAYHFYEDFFEGSEQTQNIYK